MSSILNHPKMSMGSSAYASQQYGDQQATGKPPHVLTNASASEVWASEHALQAQPHMGNMDVANNVGYSNDSAANGPAFDFEQAQQMQMQNQHQQYLGAKYDEPNENVLSSQSVLRRQALNDNMYMEQFKENHQARSLVDMGALARGYIQAEQLITASDEPQLQNFKPATYGP